MAKGKQQGERKLQTINLPKDSEYQSKFKAFTELIKLKQEEQKKLAKQELMSGRKNVVELAKFERENRNKAEKELADYRKALLELSAEE